MFLFSPALTLLKKEGAKNSLENKVIELARIIFASEDASTPRINTGGRSPLLKLDGALRGRIEGWGTTVLPQEGALYRRI